MSELQGQLSMYDVMAENQQKRPCDYTFKRYIGQHVKFSGTYSAHAGETGTVTVIKPYYTYVRMENGDELVGTPYDIRPAEEEK